MRLASADEPCFDQDASVLFEQEGHVAVNYDFIDTYGLVEYAKWHLGIHIAQTKTSKRGNGFPFSDLQTIHRCALLRAENRFGQYKYFDIKRTAGYMHDKPGESRHRKSA